jgi:hypothetical protein
VFGAKRLSVVRFLKQNNKTKIASGWKVFNKVFAVTGGKKNVIGLRTFLPGKHPSRRAGVVFADRFEDSSAGLGGR